MKLQSPKDELDVCVYKCSFCEKSFGQLRYKKLHEDHHCFLNPEKINQKESKLYTCQTCNASYTHKSNFTKHIRHDCGRSHICKNCGHIYSDISSLRRHFRKGACMRETC